MVVHQNLTLRTMLNMTVELSMFKSKLKVEPYVISISRAISLVYAIGAKSKTNLLGYHLKLQRLRPSLNVTMKAGTSETLRMMN